MAIDILASAMTARFLAESGDSTPPPRGQSRNLSSPQPGMTSTGCQETGKERAENRAAPPWADSIRKVSFARHSIVIYQCSENSRIATRESPGGW
jgi:hypothetical protein